VSWPNPMRIQLPSRLTYEQQCEVTIKEGMFDEAILIMVVDKSATIGVNSDTRFGSLSG
jgi:hypothetical protein